MLGTLLSMKHQFRVMQARGTGAIVNLSSVYGQKGAPGGSLYSASKHAVIGLASGRASNLTGQAIVVDGGLTAQ